MLGNWLIIGGLLIVMFAVCVAGLLEPGGSTDGDDEIGLGEDAGGPPPIDVQVAARARAAAGLRSRADLARLCVRLEKRRLDARRNIPDAWLLGAPYDEVAAGEPAQGTDAADRVRT